MRAIAITPLQAHTARIVEIPRPTAPAGGALVRIIEIGIDGTDMELESGHIGQTPAGQDFLVIGHESVGVVEEAGAKSALRAGDLVVATVRRPDDCPNCLAGATDMCLKGEYTERGIFRAHGLLTEYYADSDPFLVKIPPPLRALGVLVEPISVAEKAVRHAWEIQRRLLWQPRRSLVFGAGSLGLLAAFLLRLRGMDVDVYSREPKDSARAKLVERSGARYLTQIPTNEYDFIFEATGAPQLILTGMGLLGRNGVLAVLGVSGSHEKLPVPVGEFNNRLVLGNHVVFGSVNSNRCDFDQGVVDLGAIDERWPGLLAAMYTRREPFDQYMRALTRSPEDIKVVVEIHPCD